MIPLGPGVRTPSALPSFPDVCTIPTEQGSRSLATKGRAISDRRGSGMGAGPHALNRRCC